MHKRRASSPSSSPQRTQMDNSDVFSPTSAMIEVRIAQSELLWRTLGDFLMPTLVSVINFSPEEVSLAVKYPGEVLVMALRIPASSCEFFHCNLRGSTAVYTCLLHAGLYSSGDEVTVTMRCNAEDYLLSCIFKNARTHEISYSEVELLEVTNDTSVEIDAFADEEFEVLAGVPSMEFMRITHRISQSSRSVAISISDSAVEFSAGKEVITLLKKRGECITWGATDARPARLVFGLNRLNAMKSAACRSHITWILKCPGVFDVLDFPVEGLGNIFFYFGCQMHDESKIKLFGM